MLNENGILSFVLPKSFINCLYYDKTRKFIDSNFTIIDILDCNDKYIDTQQKTIILLLQKKPTSTNSQFAMNINNYTIFGTPSDIKSIRSLYNESTSLHNLGFEVNVGNVVWNQCKPILTDDTSKNPINI